MGLEDQLKVIGCASLAASFISVRRDEGGLGVGAANFVFALSIC